MQIEKKLLAYSAIALLIGVASIAPLLFLMSGTAKAETTIDKPWFNLNIPYAYFTANSTQYLNGSLSYGAWHAIVLNGTLNSDTANDAVDARIDYFQMQVYSDKESIANLTYFFGANRTGSVDPTDFLFERDNWFSTNTTGGGSFTLGLNVSESTLTATSGALEGWMSSPNNELNHTIPQFVSKISNAEAIYIDVSRLGWVTFSGNNTIVTLADNAVLQHIELTKFGDGFLYNNLIPQDQLSQADLLAPLRSMPQQPNP